MRPFSCSAPNAQTNALPRYPPPTQIRGESNTHRAFYGTTVQRQPHEKHKRRPNATALYTRHHVTSVQYAVKGAAMRNIEIIPVPFDNQGWAACSVNETLSPYFPTEAEALAWIRSHPQKTREETAA